MSRQLSERVDNILKVPGELRLYVPSKVCFPVVVPFKLSNIVALVSQIVWIVCPAEAIV